MSTTAGAPASERGTARHREPLRRTPVLVFVLAVFVVAGIVGGAASSNPTPAVVPDPAALSASAAAESSTWYCTGGSGTGGIATPSIYLVNSTSTAVGGTMTVVNDAGTSGSVQVLVPPGSETVAEPGAVEQGGWLAARFDFNGGGVTASELVDGSAGWAVSPCASSTSTSWYFASGATSNGNSLFVSLYNPTAMAAVVDLTFVVPGGATQPAPFEGIVIQPGDVDVAEVASYVQNEGSVATEVQARSGRVVAAELQSYVTSSVSGLSLRLGAIAPENQWAFPRSVDVTGGNTTFVVFNPGSSPQRVAVGIQLASGPVAPFAHTVPAHATWRLTTSGQSRVPDNTDFATTVSDPGGTGITVDRIESLPATAAPQWGAVSGIAQSTSAAPSGRWVVPTTAPAASPPVSGAAPYALALSNTGSSPETVHVDEVTPAGLRPLRGERPVTLGAGQFTVIEQPALTAAGTHALAVQSTGPMAAMADQIPAAMSGLVSMPGIAEAP